MTRDLQALAHAFGEIVENASRNELCRVLGRALAEAGKQTWIAGFIIGSHRVDGSSPFGFGDDGLVGLSTVAQVGGQLVSGTAQLLDVDNRYAAAALLRQLVEVEYLAWAFAHDREEATAWLRTSKEERLKRWQPRHLRERSQGLFRGHDYGHHCELGGHPTPDSRRLLPEHQQIAVDALWLELAIHGSSTWRYFVEGSFAFSCERLVAAVDVQFGVTTALDAWRASDALRQELGVFRQRDRVGG